MRFLSLREKGAIKSRNKSPQPGTTVRLKPGPHFEANGRTDVCIAQSKPLTTETFKSLFRNDARRDSAVEDDRELQGEKLEAKVCKSTILSHRGVMF